MSPLEPVGSLLAVSTKATVMVTSKLAPCKGRFFGLDKTLFLSINIGVATRQRNRINEIITKKSEGKKAKLNVRKSEAINRKREEKKRSDATRQCEATMRQCEAKMRKTTRNSENIKITTRLYFSCSQTLSYPEL